MRNSSVVFIILFCFFACIAADSFADSDGVRIEFSALPLNAGELREGGHATMRFRITNTGTGEPLTSLRPMAWIDRTNGPGEKSAGSFTCEDRVGAHLQRRLGARPDIDLGGYFILTMNSDASLSVIDPMNGVKGITQLYAMVTLDAPGEDWAADSDRGKLFVTMPSVRQVAVVDTGTFKVIKNIDTGSAPGRIALQPDGAYVWIGNNAGDRDESGVVAIDAERLTVAARIPTGAGHHDMAFSENSRYVFVTSDKDRTVSVIDTQLLRKIKDIETGGVPVAIAFSQASGAVYAASEDDGVITVIDAQRHEVARRIKTAPGLTELRFSPDGRWGFAVNAKKDLVHIIDAMSNRAVHSVGTGAAPYQVAFTGKAAYIRSQGTGDITLIHLSDLDTNAPRAALRIPIGQSAPQASPSYSLAPALFPAPEGDVMLITNPADTLTYYYREDMQAPMGTFKNYGRSPRAVRVVDRGLREKGDGTYTAGIRLPESGAYQVAFFIDTPKVVECFELTVPPGHRLSNKHDKGLLKVEFLTRETKIRPGEKVGLQFRLTDAVSNEPKDGVGDLIVLASLASGQWQQRYQATPVGGGIYETQLSLPRQGVYYVFLSSPSLKAGFNRMEHLVLQAADK